MTISVSSSAVDSPGGVRVARSVVTFDNSYPTGGEAFVASDLGLQHVDFCVCIPRASGHVVQFDKANGKLVVYRSGNANIKTFVVAGAAAGNVTVTGIATTDVLKSVIRLDRDATAANVNLSDLTSEFAICAADTIGNAAGTNTTGDALLVVVARPSTNGALLEVPATTDLATLVVDVLAFQINPANPA